MIDRLARLVAELRRRKVISAGIMYLVVAFVTMQIVDAVFQYLPFSDPTAAGQLVLTILAAGFPVALVLSWVLDVTPPQLRRESPRDETEAPTPIGATRVPQELRPDSVAVLPFENLSDDPENAYFSDGITDDIIAAVAHIRGLRVLSRTSVMQYKGVSRRVEEIATELGVATIVLGSVRRSGSRVRIVAKVVDAASDDHLWSETYDRELEDIFEIQSDVAARIAEAVRRELSTADRERIEGRGTTDPEAYDLYLRARFLWNQRTEVAVAESVQFFQRAIERDPAFALAHSGLAEAYTVLGIYGASAPTDVLVAARRSADAALAIDPILGEAVAARACVSGILDWDWAAAETGFRHALELAPSYATAHQWYAMNVLAPQARFCDAFDALELARALDPTSSAISVSRAIVAFYQRDYSAAAAEFEALSRLHPRFGLVHYFLGQCQELLGNRDEGTASLERAVELSDESSETLAAWGHALARNGRDQAAEAILSRLEQRAQRRYVSPALIAQVLIGLDRTSLALERLEEAAGSRATDLIWLGVRPVYDPLRTAPRFTAIVHELGLGSTDPVGDEGRAGEIRA